MILTCPECSTRYMVPDQAIGPNGRTVRCAKCAHQWFETPPGAGAEAAAAVPAAGEAAPPAAATGKAKVPVPVARPVKPAGAGVKAAFAAALALCLLASALLYRNAVVDLLPAAQKAYDLAGLYDTEGLRLTDTALEPFASDGKEGYAIRGTLVNQADAPRQVPALRLSAFSADGRLIRAYEYTSSGKTIGPGESIPFAQHLSVSEKPAYITLDIGNRFEISLRN